MSAAQIRVLLDDILSTARRARRLADTDDFITVCETNDTADVLKWLNDFNNFDVELRRWLRDLTPVTPEKHTVQDLRKMAATRRVPNYQYLNKEELIRELNLRESTGTDPVLGESGVAENVTTCDELPGQTPPGGE